MNQTVAVASCPCCSRRFVFDPDDVPTVLVSAGRALDPAGPVPDDAERFPLCYRCAAAVDELRAAYGMPELWAARSGTAP